MLSEPPYVDDFVVTGYLVRPALWLCGMNAASTSFPAEAGIHTRGVIRPNYYFLDVDFPDDSVSI